MARESDLLLWDGSRGSGFILKVRMQKGLVDAYQGASIAINGVCLTVLEWPVKDGVVSFGVAPETIKLTNLVRASISQYRAATRLTPRPYFCNLGDPLAPRKKTDHNERESNFPKFAVSVNEKAVIFRLLTSKSAANFNHSRTRTRHHLATL